MTCDVSAARYEIDALVSAFFDLFTTRGGVRVELGALRALCIPQALIVKAVGSKPEVHDLDSFVASRERLLNDGSLVDFHERELSSHTDIFGNIAQRWCRYRKAGASHGKAFDTEGSKSLQFVRTATGWRISAVIWDDEPSPGA